ncbi:MAG: hypothetical protein HYR97_07395 [Candidatus Melainabacteria bacterium]|nr:hypothetical protein [Candidatus Melainabacteria bacterium]
MTVMKNKYLIWFILVFLSNLLIYTQADASVLRNILFWKTKSSSVKSPTVDKETTLKAKAVYLQLEGDNVEFDQEKNIYITTGMSVAHIVDQDAILEADQIIYYGSNQEIEAIGNIKITRDEVVSTGKSFKFDATSNKYLLTEPETKVTGAVIKARNAENRSEKQGGGLEYSDGEFTLDEPIALAQGFGSKRKHPKTFYSSQKAKQSEKNPGWEGVSKNRKYKVTAEKIVYDYAKEIKNLTVYGARVHFDKFSLPAAPKVTLTVNSDENIKTAPLISPTFGTQGALGGFSLGPSFNFNLTNYHLVSLSPFGQIGDGAGFGIGGKVGFHGPTTIAEFAYGSLKDRFTGEFRQKLFRDDTEFRAGWNQYFDNGFLGRTLPEYEIGIVDKRVVKFPFTEGGIMLRTTGNWSQADVAILPSRFEDFLKEEGSPKDLEKNAFKIEEQLAVVSKPLFQIGKEKLNTALRLKSQNAFRAYSTGDLQTILTGGPILDNTVGPATFEIGYLQGLVKGESPLLYDQFIQGKQSVLLDGDIKLHEWVSLGGYGTYNLKAEEVVDRQVRAKIGPKDFKVLVNWDALRQQTQFGLNFLFGQPVEFEKFLILNSLRNVSGI